MEAKELVEHITDFVNSFNDKSVEFNKAMSNQHRTLQQSFTRLALKWIENVASDEYLTDGRNEQSKEVCRTLLNGFKDKQAEIGYRDTTLELMAKPSGHLGTI